jgi:acetyl-CoA/propionyl-CoA carboxylase biotin carboxyl carrier protein
VLVERYLERPRHVEVQVIGDAHGTVLHLGERECSLQRRHQKVIEEAPSPVVSAELRARMGEAAVALARSCGYTNAGTVELIADRDDPSQFFFLEMNARLQVEHPVTELVTGLDLVELQLRVAAGEPLGLAQDDVRLDGHAIEARLYAEDPANGFLPSTGRVVVYREPHGVRVDSGLAEGSDVTSHYDPMLAKVIAHAPTRTEAIDTLARALTDTRVLGPTTNAAYLRALLARPEVRAGELDTGLIERLGDAIGPPPRDPALPGLALVALLGAPDGEDPWAARDGWRLGAAAAPAQMRLAGPDGDVEAIATPDADGGWLVRDQLTPAGGAAAAPAAAALAGEDVAATTRARLVASSDGCDGTVVLAGSGGVSRTVEVHRDGDAVWLVDDGVPSRFAPIADEATRHHAAGSLEAPMPGVVLDVRTEPGREVAEGDVLVVLESMKMELSVASPGAGVVELVHVSAGDRVSQGQPLVALAAPEAS